MAYYNQVILSLGQDKTQSSSFIVENFNSPVLVSLFTVNNERLPKENCQFRLQRQNNAGGWEDVSTIQYGSVVLDYDTRMIVVDAPGVYRVQRPNLEDADVSVGVQVDTFVDTNDEI